MWYERLRKARLRDLQRQKKWNEIMNFLDKVQEDAMLASVVCHY